MAKPGKKPGKSTRSGPLEISRKSLLGPGARYQSRDARGRWSKTGTIKFPIDIGTAPKIDFQNFKPNLKTVEDYTINVRENGVLGVKEISKPTMAQLYENLRASICTLFFYKITNGQYRKMVCTLVDHEPVPSIYNRPGIMVVWDVEADNWRSFYPQRIVKLIRNEQTRAQ